MNDNPSILDKREIKGGIFLKKQRFQSKTTDMENSTPNSWTTEDSKETTKLKSKKKKNQFAHEEIIPKIFQILNSNKTEVTLNFLSFIGKFSGFN